MRPDNVGLGGFDSHPLPPRVAPPRRRAVAWTAILLGIALVTRVPDAHAQNAQPPAGVAAAIRDTLAPAISPNKTWEGLAFGIFTAILAVWIVNWYQDFIDTPQALILGASVALVAPLGDLFESFIKRDVGTKDTGRLFGAHGGALDRLDAVLFTLVVGYYVWLALLPF